LHPSTFHPGGKQAAEATHDIQTRSSSNAWLSRQHSTLAESLYQRAAHVLGIDPHLLQGDHDQDARYHSIAESIQVVHYKAGGEEYHAHHDFVYPSVTHRYQPTRFATLLVYLNSVTDGGGATRFPRAVNKEKAEGIEVKPQQGRAVLFYNLLPDGNVDDLSQHGSNPTKRQEKWMANIWVWDPLIN
jgi:prolyl 4-hydroxylase